MVLFVLRLVFWVIQKLAAVGQNAFDVSPAPRQSAFKNEGLLLRLWPFKSAKEIF
jgi:hypothetical protein